MVVGYLMRVNWLKEHRLLVLTMLCFLVLPQFTYLWALKRSDNPHIISALSSLGPLMTLLLLVLFYKKQVSLASMFGVALVVMGGALLVSTE